MSWFKPLLDILKNLDDAVDHAAELFHEHVTPVVQDAAGRLDRFLEDKGEAIQTDVRSVAVDLDDRWQRFMVRRVDPIFGQIRSDQLTEMGGLDINPQEVALNRRVALAGLAFIAIAGGGAIFPASLAVSVPLSFGLVLPVYEMAVRSVKQQRRVTYHVLSAVNITGIWLTGFYTPMVAAMVLYYMGEKLLLVTEDRSKKGVISVFSKQPRSVWVLRDGGVEEEVPFEELARGDVIVVGAGGFMPVDGTVVEGIASIDQQMLTGEAQPVERTLGESVFASTLVLAGKIHVRVDKAGDETVAAKIGEILNKTASYQLALQSRGSEIAHRSALPVLALGGLTLVTLGPESALAILNSSFGVSVRVSAPVTMLNLLNIASYHAILLKDGRSLELLSDIDTVLFDKTGTLTLTQPNVAAVHVVDGIDADRLLALAAAAEHRQSHPIALAIVAEAGARGLSLPEIDHARYDVGYGIKVELGEQRIQVGSDRFMRLEGIEIPAMIEEQQEACHAQGHSLVMVAIDGRLAGAVELQPTIRPEAAEVIQALRDRGLNMVIISGDQEEPTRRLAAKLGIERHFANVLPEGKAGLVEQLQAEGHSVCFVGDGINDSIALKKANVSVSLRGATTVATDSAQVVLMQESLKQLPYLFKLSEDMERSLKLSYLAGMIPGAINVAGVFLLGWGFYPAMGLSLASLWAGLGIAMYPWYRHKKELEQAGAHHGAADLAPHTGPGDVPALPAAAAAA